MTVHLYSMMRNEMTLLPFFFRHYEQFVDKFFIYEDHSDDGTFEYLRDKPNVELHHTGMNKHDDVLIAELYSTEYRKLSRGKADWVFCVDSDEFVYPIYEINPYGYDGIVAKGYQMVADEPPDSSLMGGQIYHYYDRGFPDPMYDKLICFMPEIDVQYVPGRHQFMTHAKIHYSSIKLLHYRWLGEEWMKQRNKRSFDRLSENSLRCGYGITSSPDWTGIYSLDWWREKIKEAKPCVY